MFGSSSGNLITLVLPEGGFGIRWVFGKVYGVCGIVAGTTPWGTLGDSSYWGILAQDSLVSSAAVVCFLRPRDGFKPPDCGETGGRGRLRRRMQSLAHRARRSKGTKGGQGNLL